MHTHVFVTTSIPYVNSSPHIGHAQEFVLADALARAYRLRGARVVLQTGADENASKNVVAAKRSGLSVREHVDLQTAKFESLVSLLGIRANTFVRTSDEAHFRAVSEFWKRLDPEDLDERVYRGLYCQGCEDFLTATDLDSSGRCPDHRSAPEILEETNVFFRLSRYQSDLEKLIVSDRLRIRPLHRRNEVLAFLRRGLHDISVTRPSDRSEGWGVPVPGRSGHVIYVWIDALINYLSGQGFGSTEHWKSVWSEDVHKVHVIGKNITKFHAIYWPALLLSAGLPLPNEILVHGFLTSGGVKISKSLGNTVDPHEIVEAFGADALRHYLLSEVPISEDADFSQTALVAAHDRDLSDRLGNLVSRVLTLGERAGFETASESSLATSRNDESWLETALTELELSGCLRTAIWSIVDRWNKRIQDERPWEWLKAGDEGRQKLKVLLSLAVEDLRLIAHRLEPFLPEAARKLSLALNEGRRQILFPKLGVS